MTNECRGCGSSNVQTARFCGACGFAIRPVAAGPIAVLTPDAIRRLVGRHADYYVRTFDRMFSTGTVRLKPSWNWAAFLGSFLWLLYRGLFVEALVLLSFELLLGFAHLPLWPLLLVGQGVFGNAVYFLALERRARRAMLSAAWKAT